MIPARPIVAKAVEHLKFQPKTIGDVQMGTSTRHYVYVHVCVCVFQPHWYRIYLDSSVWLGGDTGRPASQTYYDLLVRAEPFWQTKSFQRFHFWLCPSKDG